MGPPRLPRLVAASSFQSTEKLDDSEGQITSMIEMRGVYRSKPARWREMPVRSLVDNRKPIPLEEGDFHWGIGIMVIFACVGKGVERTVSVCH